MRLSREFWPKRWNDPREAAQRPASNLLDEIERELQTRLELIEAEDPEGLVTFLEGVVRRRPEDAYAAKDLGEAYVLQGEPLAALELLTPLHRRHPHFEDVQWVLLDALFAAGRDEDSFDWIRRPPVVRLTPLTLELCYHLVDDRDGPWELEDLYAELLCEGYCAFSEEGLRTALRRDGRFAVREDAIGLHRRARATDEARSD